MTSASTIIYLPSAMVLSARPGSSPRSRYGLLSFPAQNPSLPFWAPESVTCHSIWGCRCPTKSTLPGGTEWQKECACFGSTISTQFVHYPPTLRCVRVTPHPPTPPPPPHPSPPV